MAVPVHSARTRAQLGELRQDIVLLHPECLVVPLASLAPFQPFWRQYRGHRYLKWYSPTVSPVSGDKAWNHTCTGGGAEVRGFDKCNHVRTSVSSC